MAETGGALFPWAPIKTSFGKVAAFYPSLFLDVFFFFATSLNKTAGKEAVKAGY